jgi:hypothetical protein
LAVPEVDLAQLIEGEITHPPGSPGHPLQVWIVAHDGHAVATRVHVGFDVRHTGGHGSREREQRVFGRVER